MNTLLTNSIKNVSNNGPHIITSTQMFRITTTINGIVTPNLKHQMLIPSLKTKSCQQPKQYLGIKKVSRHTLRAGKSAVYAASRPSFYYSNSIVPGGLLVRSQNTRLTPFTSLMILLITFCSTSNGISAASAVIKSIVFTALSATAQS